MTPSSPQRRFTGVIPARGGSKSIPGKNLALLGGRPLLSYTCQAARQSRLLGDTVVSTDDAGVAAVAEKEGLVVVERPAGLAEDDTPMIAVLSHALAWARAADEEPDGFVLLQPTSPLRNAEHIDAALELFEQTGADSVVSIVAVPHQYNPVSVLRREGDLVRPFLDDSTMPARRQDKPAVWARNGPAILVTSPMCIDAGVLYGDQTVGYVMDRWSSLDIDDADDLALAELVMTRQHDGVPAD